ncbi:MAG: polysaccharide deacetylase [Pseudonocardia sp. SCN 72-86]|nr:MAG: polysaccharide deacetylase [Pseudonocardia sp. SCN 72-86]
MPAARASVAWPDPPPREPAFPSRPALTRTSAVLTALLFGMITFVSAPDSPFRIVAPPPPPVTVAPAGLPAVPQVITEVRANGTAGARTIALTFDDGPDPTWTPKVLDVLARNGAVATFCMVGTQIERHPELVAQVTGAGMRLCSHSRSHDESLATRPEPAMLAEITDVRDRTANDPRADVRYFRAPGGFWSPVMLNDAATHDLQPLGWSIDPRDWNRPGADAIVTTVQKNIHSGAIVLLHDGGGNRAQTVAALERLLPWLTSQGYTFVVP